MNLIKDCIIINVFIITKLCPTSTSLTSTRFLQHCQMHLTGGGMLPLVHQKVQKKHNKTIFRRKDYRHWQGPWFVVLFRCLTASHSTHFSAAPSVQFFCPESIPSLLSVKLHFHIKLNNHCL